MSEVRISAETRTEFGKGAARRVRRAGKVPAVLYGHGTEPRHISLPGHDLMIALKTPNVLLRLDGVNKDNLVLPKAVQRDAIKGFLEHVDLIVVKKGEKVTVDIPLHLTGEIASGGVLNQELVSLEIEAEATHIPESIEFSVEGLEVGTQVTAVEVSLPAGASLQSDSEALVLTIAAERSDEELEAELTTEEGEEPATAGADEESEAGSE